MALTGRSPGRRLVRALGTLLAAVLLLTALLVVPWRWVAPPTTRFMLAEDGEVHHEWVPLERIAPALALAVVAAEDQRFPKHYGFDLEAIQAAARHNARGGRLRGASTLTQQLAKNLYLSRDRSYLRKGLEAWFTLWLEATWPKRRILEVYLNVVEFGPGLYGAEAAAWRHFGRPAAALGGAEAALLAAVLPNPRRYDAGAPSARVRARQAWIRAQMRQLGSDYLRGL